MPKMIAIPTLKKKSRADKRSHSHIHFPSNSFVGRGMSGFLESNKVDGVGRYPRGAEGKVKQLFRNKRDANKHHYPVFAVKIFTTSPGEFADLEAVKVRREYRGHKILGRKVFLAQRSTEEDVANHKPARVKYYLATPFIPGYDLSDCLTDSMKSQEIHQHGLSGFIGKFTGLARQIEKFHAKGYVNLDFKPQNIRFNSQKDTLELLDLSSVIKDKSESFVREECGCTFDYFPPEILKGEDKGVKRAFARQHFSQTSEVYSFFMMFAQFMPNSEKYFIKQDIDMLHIQFKANHVAIDQLPEGVEKSLLQFVAKACDPDLTVRQTFSIGEAIHALEKYKKELDQKFVAQFKKEYKSKVGFFGGRAGRVMFLNSLRGKQTTQAELEVLAKKGKPDSATARTIDFLKKKEVEASSSSSLNGESAQPSTPTISSMRNHH